MIFPTASSSGTRLHRGYVEEATLEDKNTSQTTHIIICCAWHWTENGPGRIIKNTAM